MTSVCSAPIPIPDTPSRSRRMFFTRAIHLLSRPLQSEGAGKAGCALHPRSRVQNCAKSTHTSIQVQRRQSDFPCAVVLTLIFVLSPAIRPWVVTVACASSRKLDASLEASGPHDFTVRITRRSLSARSAATASPPHVRGDRERPSEWDGISEI